MRSKTNAVFQRCKQILQLISTVGTTNQTNVVQVDPEPAKAAAAKAMEEDSDDDSSSSSSDSDEDSSDSDDDSDDSDSSSSEDEEDVSQHLVIPTVRGRSASGPRSRLSGGF